MVGREIRLLITDFDGTLVDTFRANYMAYRKAFEEMGLVLQETEYSGVSVRKEGRRKFYRP